MIGLADSLAKSERLTEVITRDDVRKKTGVTVAEPSPSCNDLIIDLNWAMMDPKRSLIPQHFLRPSGNKGIVTLS
jgi:hypothetical protein